MIRFIPCNKQKVQIMEEWKIGEIRQIDNEWYQCLESSSCRCDYCDYGELGDCHKIACASGERSDDKEVYFKRLEKIGKNLKPFDLEEAKAGKPVCTRDGRKARVICFDMNSFNNHIIVALITEENGTESIYSYTSEGKWKETKTENDLMMLPEKKEGWINIYNADTTFYYVDGRVFETKDEAVKEAKEEVEKEQREKNEYIDTIRVEWEE